MVSQLFKEINQFISGRLPLFLWPSLPLSTQPGISPSLLREEAFPEGDVPGGGMEPLSP